ncbi:unnamed protein product [Bathycoccus prasinos]
MTLNMRSAKNNAKKNKTFYSSFVLLLRSLLADDETITESTAEAISEDVQDAADAVDEATETVADAADSIEEANEAIAEVAEQTEEAVEAVEEASEAVAESTEAIEDAADAVDDATEAVEDAAEQIQDTAETVDEATEAVEDAADSLADITDTAQEVLSNLEGSKAVNSLVMDKVEQEQGAVATELLTMAKEINRLEAVVTRLENYEGGGRRGGPGSGAGLGAWFKAQYADQTSFISGLVTSFLVILFIEVGDRTYFIAALMSVKHSRRIVFLGAFSALAVMTIVSTLLGVAAPMFLPRWFVHWAAVILFLGYGVTMLYNSQFMSDDVSEEFEEVEHELDEIANRRSGKKSDDNNASKDDDDVAEKGGKLSPGKKKGTSKNEKQWWEFFVSAIFVQAFTLTFLAEWGDRSQIATIAMAADYDPYGIIIGGSLGHGLATSTACIGGRILAQKISEKKIAMVGGGIFLIFGILAVFDDPSADYTKALPKWMKTSSSGSVLAEETLEGGDEAKDSISKRILEHQERAFATENTRGDNFSGFVQSLLVMLSLEFGDRTFFIASLMSGKYDSKKVFFGAIMALWLMTFVSVVIGIEAASMIPRKVMHYGSVCLFVFYGLYMLYSASRMKDTEEGEENEELKEIEEDLNSRAPMLEKDVESGNENENKKKKGGSFYECLCNGVWMQAFTLTFIAEWGDRSQIATVALAGDYEAYGIVFGCFLGHAIATGTACIGGKYIANKFSEKKMTILGGSVFLIFAAVTLLQDPNAKMEKVDWRPNWMVADAAN